MPVRNRFDFAQATASIIGGGLQGYRQGKGDRERNERAQAQKAREEERYARQVQEFEMKGRENKAREKLAMNAVQGIFDEAKFEQKELLGDSVYEDRHSRKALEELDGKLADLSELASQFDFDSDADVRSILAGAERAVQSEVYAKELKRADDLLGHHHKLAASGELAEFAGMLQHIEQLYREPGNGFGPRELGEQLTKIRRAAGEEKALLRTRDDFMQEAEEGRAAGRIATSGQRRMYDLYVSEFSTMGYVDITAEDAKGDLMMMATLDPEYSRVVFSEVFGWDPGPGRESVPRPSRTIQPRQQQAPQPQQQQQQQPTPEGKTIRPEIRAVLGAMLEGTDPEEAATAAGISLDDLSPRELEWLERMLG